MNQTTNISINPNFTWNEAIQQLSINPNAIFHGNVLQVMRQRLECNGVPLDVQDKLLDMYPKELGFSLLLCALRFPTAVNKTLIIKILNVIQEYLNYHIQYCNEKFSSDLNYVESDASTVIGEAMTILFSSFDGYTMTPQTGNLNVLKCIKNEYPNTILYVDAHDFSALHGVCCALNITIFKFFIEWHLTQNPIQRGGLYLMNDSGITPMDTLIDTQENISETLHWLRSHGLLTSKDVNNWLLIHRAAHSSSISTIQFFLDLFPSGVLYEDDDGNLPIHLHLGLRYRHIHSFSEEDFAIVQLLISQGIRNGGINTIGGIFHQDPDDEDSCTLTNLFHHVGEENNERVWEIIESCLNDHGDYANAPIVHAAIGNKKVVSNELFGKILERFGARSRDEHNWLPLTYAVKVGLAWDDGVSNILKSNQSALDEFDDETNLPFFQFAATEKADLSTLYELSLMDLGYSLGANK
jgi:ankyrin repeat protein